MEPVELRPAFQWTCPECGTDQFEAAVVAEMSKEEQSEFNQALGEAFQTGDWMLAPETVECQHCEREYTTIHYNEDPE